MQKIILITALLSLFAVDSFAQTLTFSASNFTLIGRIDPETGSNGSGDKYSGCWGWYQASKNKEYAIACGNAGTYFVDVTNPSTPTVCAYEVGLKNGATWREAKTYLNYCYVSCDNPGPNSFQIFDLQYLPDSVVKVHDSDSIFKRAHTMWIDGNKLYAASVQYSNNITSSMNVYSLVNPKAPALIRSLNQDYPFIPRVHDMFVRNDTIYASCEYQGLFVFKLQSNNTFLQLGSLTGYTDAGYNHSSALTPDGKTLVFTDEVPVSLPLKIADVTNLSNIVVTSTINQFPFTTPHNPFIPNNQYCFMSSYQDGLQLFDISNPTNPFLAGYFDTYPTSGGNTGSWPNPYGGQWGCYPFFPSKNIFALDQGFGIFMLRTHLYFDTAATDVGITKYQNDFTLALFPNPSENIITFNLPVNKLDAEFSVKIYAVTGVLVYEEVTSKMKGLGLHNKQLYTDNLQSGIYNFQLHSKTGLISSKKLVISK